MLNICPPPARVIFGKYLLFCPPFTLKMRQKVQFPTIILQNVPIFLSKWIYCPHFHLRGNFLSLPPPANDKSLFIQARFGHEGLSSRVAIWPCRWPDPRKLVIWKPSWLLKNRGWPKEKIWLKFGLICLSLATMMNSWPQKFVWPFSQIFPYFLLNRQFF